MNKVITINLGGIAYQLEEPGYDALKQYLERARAKLADNPDQEEIMDDFERAVAEKCSRNLNQRKNVITSNEIHEILAEIGPVGGTEDSSESSSEKKFSADEPVYKKLYQVREGALVSGVCMGIARYVDVDVTIIRIGLVVLTLLTNGFGILLYVFGMFLIPVAHTPEEKAAAKGTKPFKAHEFIEQAKRGYAEFRANGRISDATQKVWKDDFNSHVRTSREFAKAHEGAWKGRFNSAATNAKQAFSPLLGFASMLLGLLWLVVLFSILTSFSILGWAIPATIPLWAAVVALVFLYTIIVSPLKTARYDVNRQSGWLAPHPLESMFDAFEGILWMVFIAVLAWLAYINIPQFHDFVLNGLTYFHR